jgi:hypothetical protein
MGLRLETFSAASLYVAKLIKILKFLQDIHCIHTYFNGLTD